MVINAFLIRFMYGESLCSLTQKKDVFNLKMAAVTRSQLAELSALTPL